MVLHFVCKQLSISPCRHQLTKCLNPEHIDNLINADSNPSRPQFFIALQRGLANAFELAREEQLLSAWMEKRWALFLYMRLSQVTCLARIFHLPNSIN